MSAGLLELCVYSKQYFDPEGVIVATRDDVPVGFAHAGFGPNDQGLGLDTDMGVTQMVLLHSSLDAPELADELLGESEDYLRSRGAKVVYGGGVNPLNPFYLGLYGGSELPGVLDSDPCQGELFRRNNYVEAGRVIVMQRELTRFRSFMSRAQRQIRREMVVECNPNPVAGSWFEACQTSAVEQLDFALIRRSDNTAVASVSLWDIEPLATSWGIRTAGLWDLFVEPSCRRHGLASYLLGEAFKEILKRGILMVETHAMADNTPAIGLYEKLGFTQVDAGAVLRREADA